MAFQLGDKIVHSRAGFIGGGTIQELIDLINKPLTMSKTSQVTLVNANQAYPVPTAPVANLVTIQVYNPGSETIWYGDSSVTAATGQPLKAGEKNAFKADDGVHFVSSTAGLLVNILEFTRS